jgi:predicted ATPase
MRPREAAAPGPLKAMKHDLLMRKLGAEIAIAPLTKAALKDLLNVKLERDAPAWLTDFVHRQSEGNPLFAIAILEHLIARGALAGDGANGMDGASHDSQTENLEAAIPDELAQMIELEIEGLSAAEQHILEAGSLMRVAFPAWAVAAALEQDAGEIEEMCDELARRLHFVCRAGEDELPNGTRSAFYVFSHDLFREVLMRRQPAARRAARHVRVAERLGTLFAGREASVSREMAMHYEAAGDWLRASDALRAAAAHARERCAFAEAEDLAHHALRLAGNLDASARAAVHERIHAELGGPQELAAAGRS